MSSKIMGINPEVADATPQYALGTEVRDPRGGARSLNKIRYVRADADIAQYDAIKQKLDETDVPNAVVATSATTDFVVGVAEIAITAASAPYFWLTVKGYVPIANVADASAAGDVLGASGTAGRLATPAFTTDDPTSAELNAGVRASISGIVAAADANASNQAAVYIHG
jgi:hypothetical protein